MFFVLFCFALFVLFLFFTDLEGFPLMSVYHLNHLKCPMVDEGMKKKNQEKWGLPRIWEEPIGCLGFLLALTLSLNHSHSLPSFFSLTQSETGAM